MQTIIFFRIFAHKIRLLTKQYTNMWIILIILIIGIVFLFIYINKIEKEKIQQRDLEYHQSLGQEQKKQKKKLGF